MVQNIEFELDDEDFEKILHFKKVFDVVMNEETETEDYYRTIMAVGMKSMLKSVIPQDKDILWGALMKINEDKPEYFSEFVADILNENGENIEELKGRTALYIK